MTTYLSAKETAKIIRQELKKQFPTTKFSVTSSRYYSVSISWRDGASNEEVKAFTDRFAGKHFNGMEDIAENTKTTWMGEEVCFDTYISCNRSISLEFAQRILDYCCQKYRNHRDLDMRSVKIKTCTNDKNEVYASFDDSNCQEEAHFYDGSVAQIRKECDRLSEWDVLDWESEKQELKAKEDAELKEIQQKLDAKADFIAAAKCDLPELKEVTLHGIEYKVIGTEPIVTGEGTAEHPFKLHRWLYVTTNPEEVIVKLEASLIELALNPIVPLEIAACEVYAYGKFAVINKNCSLSTYEKYCSLPKFSNDPIYGKVENWHIEECRIIERITLTPEDYDRFVDGNLLTDFDWLKDKGYHEENEGQMFNVCVAVTAADRKTILVNPHGYSYARYVGLPKDTNIVSELFPTNCTDINQYRASKKNSSHQESLYKNWVTELVDSDRYSEIIDYQSWATTIGQSILEQQYKDFIQDCLRSGQLQDIVPLGDWLIAR